VGRGVWVGVGGGFCAQPLDVDAIAQRHGLRLDPTAGAGGPR
jgi:hypothetical protein